MSQNAASYTFSQVMDRVARKTGACVNYEDLAGITDEVPALKLRPEQHIHHGSFCEFAKQHGSMPICGKNKEKSKQVARAKKSGFEGSCPLGVWDLAEPVIWENEVVGVFYLGGFLENAGLLPVSGLTYAGPKLPGITDEKKSELRRYALHLSDELKLILDEWIRSGQKLGKKKHADFYLRAVLDYLETHYQEEASIESLAEILRLHPTYLGKLIRGHFEKSFRELLTDTRLGRAKTLLRARRDLGVTEIAHLTGFTDGNYFSTVFRKATGRTPSEYQDGR
ncbi:MAG: helix-turn-helix domain-containing protein [Spirochaetia bacterium]|nr:helix-turn-helix domain-containing protein [Spirochaetia bacterium]